MTDRPNTNAVRDATDILRDEMNPFMTRCIRRVRRGANLETNIKNALYDNQIIQFEQNLRSGKPIESAFDISAYPNFVRIYWKSVFRDEFKNDRSVESLFHLIKKARDSVAHIDVNKDLDSEYARNALFMIADVLGIIGKPDKKAQVEAIRNALFAPQATAPQDAASSQASLDPARARAKPAARNAAASSTNLRPWREVIPPHPDLGGAMLQADFAADLQRVHDGNAPEEYGNPVVFFNQTHITPGIRALLISALKRVSGNGGDPVIQTKTDFGGGKTHSLIALYHIIKSAQALINPAPSAPRETQETANAIRAIMHDAGINPDEWDEEPKIAVLDCSYLADTDPHTTPSGDPLNTLWGEMAYQLHGQDGYELIRDAALQASAPGGRQLDDLFQYDGPCLILIDELTAYLRNLKGANAATAGSTYTFIQNLTQAASRNKNVALVVTLPANQLEAGGEEGAQALQEIQGVLEHFIGRIEAVWQPLEVHESFEVVRRRLFGGVIDDAERDRACQAFYSRYNHNKRDFPDHSYERRYLDRMKACYPIHPEVFDRLHNDWSSNPLFQRTRGVLRLLASCVSRMGLENDNSPMIMPGNLPFNDAQVRDVFQRLLPGQNWGPALQEVDSDNSRVVDIDRRRQDFAGFGGAARRIARTVFLGSATTGATRGITHQDINLGVIQPGQSASAYNDALSQMRGSLYFFYDDNDRYFFHAEENLNKVASDRMAELTQPEIDEGIVAALRNSLGAHSGAAICPSDNSQVHDDPDRVQLVIMPPSRRIATRSDEAYMTHEANDAMREILLHCGGAHRINRNNLVFLAAKSDDIRALNAYTRACIAWSSIGSGPREIPNLTGERRLMATRNLRVAESNQATALARAYKQAISPSQPDPLAADFSFDTAYTVASGSESVARDIVQSALDKLKEQECLVDRLGAAALLNLLDAKNLWQGNDHISLNALWDLLARNVHLDIRLSGRDALRECVSRGVQDGAFGYASDVAEDGTYTDLKFAEFAPIPMGGNTPGLLIKPDVALRQKSAQPAQPQPGYAAADASAQSGAVLDAPAAYPDQAQPFERPLRHIAREIRARKLLTGDISTDDFADIRAELIQVLARDGAEVSVQITVRATKPDGFSDHVLRAARENAAHLDIDIQTD